MKTVAAHNSTVKKCAAALFIFPAVISVKSDTLSPFSVFFSLKSQLVSAVLAFHDFALA